MSLIVDKNVAVFDRKIINRGDAIRFRRAGETVPRNGFVTSVSDKQLQVLYANVQNTANSFIHIDAVDVAVGVWEIWWTTDFKEINYNPGADTGGAGGGGDPSG